MKQVFIKQGRAIVDEVGAPDCRPGTILVRVENSCISGGTELSGIQASGKSLWERAVNKPANLMKAIETAATHGVMNTISLVQDRMKAGSPTGYSAAGTVIAVGDPSLPFTVGDRVACAGAQCAFHAEIICVPSNLAAKIPDNVPFTEASTTTLGAIAMHGVRRISPTLGETFVVFGLGVLGQLAVQILKANGCAVIATDLNRDRIALASGFGADLVLHPDDGDLVQSVLRETLGIGADGVIITAASSSNEIISSAFQMCRRKGRVSLVGDVGLNLKRDEFYKKEIDFFISSSYGPGRYDADYEERGFDYPIGYVRWTENRNMQQYLAMLSRKEIRLEGLLTEIVPVEKAELAYEKLGNAKSVLTILSYPATVDASQRTVLNPKFKAQAKGKAARIAVIGMGGFARGMHLPNIRTMPDVFELSAVASRTGHSAAIAMQQFGAKYSTTDPARIFSDPEVDAVLIATRHDSHASLAMDALRAGKHVFVEKPLAVSPQELSLFADFYAKGEEDKPLLLTGFNRRFSPYAEKLKRLRQASRRPVILNYRMNAGYLPQDHWVHGPEGGGRNIGEACHIYDLFTFLTAERVISVTAKSISDVTGHYSSSDNFIATISFADGSVGSLTYTSMGSSQFPKEHLEMYFDGKVALMTDFSELVVHGAKGQGLKTSQVSKGQREELSAFGRAIIAGGEWPIPLWQQLQSMEIAFEVEKHLSPQAGERATKRTGNES